MDNRDQNEGIKSNQKWAVEVIAKQKKLTKKQCKKSTYRVKHQM